MTTTTLKELSSGPKQTKEPADFPAMLTAFKGEVARALPKHLSPDTMLRIALTCFRTTPKLDQCEPRSVFACVIQASQLGLRPGLLGECYLLPYQSKTKSGQWVTRCNLQLGYQGLLELVRRSGLVESISAHVVYEKDVFDVEWGTTPAIKHKPCLDGDPGKVRLFYAVAKLTGGGMHAEVMTLEQVDRIRRRSAGVIAAAKFKKETPWDTDFEEMGRKTTLRRICKYLPKSTELKSAIALDDASFRGEQDISVRDAIDNVYAAPVIEMDVDEPTGEVEPPEAAPPPPAPPAPPVDTPPAEAPAPPPRGARKPPKDAPPSYAQYVDWINSAPTIDSAGMVMDEARGVLDDQQMNELHAVFTRKWPA